MHENNSSAFASFFEPPTTRSLLLLAGLAVLGVAMLISTIVLAALLGQCKSVVPDRPVPPTPTTPPPVIPDWLRNCQSNSGTDIYELNAVAADSAVCSKIGDHVMNILGGNAMDAGVATVLCIGASNFHSSGIGGGSFVLFYNRTTKSASAFDFREEAPNAANRDMFNSGPQNASLYGGKAVAVPGEVVGLSTAHASHGRLPWRTLVNLIVELLRNGQPVTEPLARAMASTHPRIPAISPFETLKNWMINPKTKQVYKTGELLVDSKLADTMAAIADDPMAFHNGSLTDTIINELSSADAIITKEDLLRYATRLRTPIKVELSSRRLTLYSVPPPSSGAVLAFITSIMDGYGYNKNEVNAKSSREDYATFLHRLVEAFKFGYAKRSALGDAYFVNVTELVENMTSASYAEQVRQLIWDNTTHGVKYYGPSFDWKEDSGTTHVSLVDSEGNAFAATSTINTVFASFIRGPQTGILYNNEMDDFSIPNRTNIYGLAPSPSNFIAPRKRPMSSMSPTILVDSDTGEVRHVIGAAGGSRITTSIAYVLARQLYLNETVKQAVDSYRLHHQLVPNFISYDFANCNIPQSIKEALEQKGHKLMISSASSVVEGIQRLANRNLQANADFRKPSKTGGL